ncbi:MAG TPA: hypothetical protein VFH51_17095 [Myxococcota bacterium]|nr:hypothetical protein [Myxococcota bacterium]
MQQFTLDGADPKVRRALETLGLIPGGQEPKAYDPAIRARVLKEMLPAVLRKNPFKAGDIVQVNPACRITDHPRPGALCLVTEVFEQDAVERVQDHSCKTPREDMLILLSLPTPEGAEAWVELAAESWRYTAYTGPVE